MVGCAATTCLPDRDEHLCGAAAAPFERPGQGHRDLALRHQIAVLERQPGDAKVRFTPTDRAFLAALLHRLPREALRRLRLLVRPDTIVRWHRDLVTRRHAARSAPKRPGRPPTVRSIRVLVLRLVRENPSWGYRRVHGELLVLGVRVAASTVWEILWDAGIDPAPKRASSTWAGFLRSQAGSLITLKQALAVWPGYEVCRPLPDTLAEPQQTTTT
jgi:transposase